VRLVVVGGGIAGLSAAWEARRIADEGGVSLQITLLEQEPRLGGKILTEPAEGIALELGPDSFLASKLAGRELVDELGLTLVRPLETARRAYLYRGGELRPFPAGLVMGIPRELAGVARGVRSGIVSAGAGARAAIEPFLPGMPVGDGVASAELRRRLGRGWSTNLVEPLLEGVYGAPTAELGMREVLPAFAGERSLVRAARRLPRPPDPPFLSVEGGMGRLVEALKRGLANEDLRFRASARAIVRREERLFVDVGDESLQADAIVLAVPAPSAGPLLRPVAPETARELEAIRFSSSAIVLLRHSAQTLGRARTGSGYLVPSAEGLAHAACSWVTSKWPNRSADVWLRAIVTSPDHLRAGDESLVARVAEEVGTVMRATGTPLETRLHRWDHALPVYGPGHFESVDRAERGLPESIALAGASYRGLGVPDCIANGRAAARWLLDAAKP
jgi:protoporphyrinogen/coproporphyrinogen III oxidase